jgi:phosphoglycerate kinase
MFRKSICLTIVISFLCSLIMPLPQANAQSLLGLPEPGTMVNLSPSYQPPIIKGLTVYKDNPFLFDFIVDVGQDRLHGRALKKEGEKLIKYFLASLAIPEKDLWVNLSPYEKDRIVSQALGQTEMGRDLLAQDYMLKQITASLIYPEKSFGKIFWDKIYAASQAKFGTTQIPVNTFNKVWIVVDRAEVYEHNQTVFVVNCHLKVMLEEDYLALQKHTNPNVTPAKTGIHSISHQVIREIILPQLEKEVNTGKNFASLRQICSSLMLASWYKKNLKVALLNQFYTDKEKIKGIDLQDKTIKEQIYKRYLEAYKKGVFNFIKEDYSPKGLEVPRKYFSGGMQPSPQILDVTHDPSVLDEAMRATDDPLMKFTAGANINQTKMGSVTQINRQLGAEKNTSVDDEAMITDLKGLVTALDADQTAAFNSPQIRKDNKTYRTDVDHGPRHAADLLEKAVELGHAIRDSGEDGLKKYRAIEWDVLIAAIILHDIFAFDDINHGPDAINYAEHFLATQGMSPEKIKKVQAAIRWHDKRDAYGQAEREKAGIESQILFDVDQIEAFGAKGVFRFTVVYYGRYMKEVEKGTKVESDFLVYHKAAVLKNLEERWAALAFDASRSYDSDYRNLKAFFNKFDPADSNNGATRVIKFIIDHRNEHPTEFSQTAIDELSVLETTEPRNEEIKYAKAFFEKLAGVYKNENEFTKRLGSLISGANGAMNAKMRLNDLREIYGKVVVVREGYDVTLNSKGALANNNDPRITGSFDTIDLLIKKGAKVILISHLGRPQDEMRGANAERVAQIEKKLSLLPVSVRLKKQFGSAFLKFDPKLRTLDDIQRENQKIKPGQIILLENTRFNPGDEGNDPKFARDLFEGTDVFVNDAPSVMHRAQASVVGVLPNIPRVMGFLMEKEIEILNFAKQAKLAVMGGSKVTDKIKVIRAFLDADQERRVAIGGAMANAFLKAQGKKLGASKGIDQDNVAEAESLLRDYGDRIILPVDLVEVNDFGDPKASKTIAVDDGVQDGWIAVDIGPKTSEMYASLIEDAPSVFWNGPMGAYDTAAARFATFGTLTVARTIGLADEKAVIGGGDSVTAYYSLLTRAFRSGRQVKIATGGGASLEFLEGKQLPGIQILSAPSDHSPMAINQNDRAQVVRGGIDLNTGKTIWVDRKEGAGVEMKVDQTMIERVQREGIDSLNLEIYSITPVVSIWPLVGLETPKEPEERLARI